jgi:hypothetical protein
MKERHTYARECRICGVLFTTTRGYKFSCSNACSREWAIASNLTPERREYKKLKERERLKSAENRNKKNTAARIKLKTMSSDQRTELASRRKETSRQYKYRKISAYKALTELGLMEKAIPRSFRDYNLKLAVAYRIVREMESKHADIS